MNKRGRKTQYHCPDVAELRRQIEIDGVRPTDIARKHGRAMKTVSRWIREAGITVPPYRPAPTPAPAVEEWRPIAGWERQYEVSSVGRVRSLDRRVGNRLMKGCMLKPYLGRRKYPHLIVNLRRGGKRSPYAISENPLVHRLVLLAFVGPAPKGMVCCHLNGDGTDNRLENLRWDTPSNNQRDSMLHGTHHWLKHIERRRASRRVSP